MSFKLLSKALPTSEDSIAYTHMVSFLIGKNNGIRKWIPNFIDFRINAIALMVLATCDLILATTRLCLYTLAVVPIFLTKKPIFKDFFFSIATLVKATLAFIHGQKEGLLPFSEYELFARAVLKDNALLLEMPLTANEHDKTVLRSLVENLGVNRCLNDLYDNDKMELLDNVISTCNAQASFLSLMLNKYNPQIPDVNKQRLFRYFSCAPDGHDFVISVLTDPTITDGIKANLVRLCRIQTNIYNENGGLDEIVGRLKPAIILEAESANQATQHTMEVRNKLKSELGNDNLQDALLLDLPQADVFRKVLQEQTAIQMSYDKKLNGLIEIIKLRPLLVFQLSNELYEKNTLRFGAILRDVINAEGLKPALKRLIADKNYELLQRVVTACNAKSELFEIISSSNQRLPDDLRQFLFQTFRCNQDNFVISMLADQEVSEKIKDDLARLCAIQLDDRDSQLSQNEFIAALINSVVELYHPFQRAREKTQEVERKLKAEKAELGLGDDDDFPDEVSPEIEALQQEYQRASSQEARPRLVYDQKLRQLVSVLNRCPAYFLNLSPAILETSAPNPTTRQLKYLFEKRLEIFQSLLNLIPKALAGSADPASGESFVMYLLNKERYHLAFELLKLDSEQLDRKTVFDLLKSGMTYFSTAESLVTQQDIAKILFKDHEELVTLYRAYGESSAKDIDAQPTLNDKLKAIAVSLGITGGSVRTFALAAMRTPARASLLDALLSNRTLKMVHKASAEKEVLLDIPHIDIMRDAIALADRVGANTAGVRQCLRAILGTTELEIQAKHIIAGLQAKLAIGGNENKEIVKGFLNYLDEEGNDGCNVRKQNVLPVILNSLRNAKIVNSEEKDREKLRDYLSSFKDKIAFQILPPEVDDRSEWGMTLYKERHIQSARAGNRNYHYQRPLQRRPEAIAAFDERYRPHNFVAFLRAGINDDNNKLRKGFSDTIEEFLKILPDEMQTQLSPLITDYNGKYTDFALFCVLIHMNFIEFEV